MMKRILSFVLAILLTFSVLTLVSCGDPNAAGGEVAKLSFAEANKIENMEKLDGQKVSIIGYMSTLSPVNGSFMYLMNMPYQSCPFCEPNTTQLSNTLAVYAKNGKAFEFTDLLIRVEGTLEFGEYTDEYGYQYNYRIKDATYKKVDTSELDDEFLLWQQLAQTGVIADVYAMYDYINFLCFWSQYPLIIDGVASDYLYPDDALWFIETEGEAFNYGYADGYFDDMIRRIEEVDAEAFSALEDNIRRAKALAERALSDLRNGNYTKVTEYTGTFNDGRVQYKMNAYDEFGAEISAIFSEFASWIAEWEI